MSPTVRRRQLGIELRRRREAAGKTLDEAAKWLGVTQSNLSKIELGRQTVKAMHIRGLAQLYGIEVPDIDTLLRLAAEANQRGWWVAYGDTVPDWFEQYVGLEAGAHELRAFEAGVVLGLMQTAAYAEALTRAAHPDMPNDRLHRIIEVRKTRQDLLTAEDPLTVHVVLDEAVLHRPIGGADVMRGQLEHLAEMSELPNVDLRVQPFGAGAHASVGASFSLLRFPDELGFSCVYLENDRGALYLERPADVTRYASMHEAITATALSSAESVELMDRVAASLGE